MEEGRRGGSAGGASAASSHEEELRSLAHGIFSEGERMMRLKPMPQVHDSVRGLPMVVRALAQADGPMSPGELARASKVTDARIANILKVLEERGIVERRTSMADRRRVEVTLTEKGRAEQRDRAEEGLRFMVGFLEDLGIDDARELLRLVRRMNDVAERRRAEGRAVHPGCGDAPAGGERS